MKKFSEFCVIRKLIVVFINSRNLSSAYRYFVTTLTKVSVEGIFNIICTMHSVEIRFLSHPYLRWNIYEYITEAQNLLEVSAGHSMGAENCRTRFCASVM